MNRILHSAAFLAGLAVLGWIGAAYVGTSPLALAITVLIAAFYLAGAVELHRYRRDTETLAAAVDGLDGAPADLGDWLAALPQALRPAVRLRIEGERVGLPGPALAPYLAGLLVLLGMVGTFLGMVVTLNGTGAALESATGLEAIRASLSAPVKGLGLAFGTSVAGVAASAMLGLVSALCRRERLQAGQRLDARIAGSLRVFSLAHRREESFRLLQLQAGAMPLLVERLQSMMDAMERQSAALGARLQADQQGFHERTASVYDGLAASVERSLQRSLAEGARQAGEVIRPLVQATMAGIAHETTALHQTLAGTLQRQLEDMSRGLAETTAAVAGTWNGAIREHQQRSEALSANLYGTLERHAQGFEQRSAGLVEQIAARLEHSNATLAQTWGDAAARQEAAAQRHGAETQQALAAATQRFGQQTLEWEQAVESSHQRLQAQLVAADTQRMQAWAASLEAKALADAQRLETWERSLEAKAVSDDQRLAGWTSALEAMAAADDQRRLAWTSALEANAAADNERRAAWIGALEAKATADDQRLAAWSAALDRKAVTDDQRLATWSASLDATSAADAQRLAAWTAALEAMAMALRQEWQAAGAQAAQQQAAVCDTLAATAHSIAEHGAAQVRGTLAQIGELVQAAAEAPRAAAEVVAELRQKLSDSLAHDNTLLEERNRMLQTLGTLLDAVQHASTEQRTAIDALVAASAGVLQDAGARLAAQAEAGAAQLGEVAAQLGGSALEVASLGEAFGHAVQRFGDSSEKLGAQLQRIEAALGLSLSRSDEQLAYYVAQAREVIDLSMLSQRQIVEDLQQIAARQAAAPAGSPA